VLISLRPAEGSLADRSPPRPAVDKVLTAKALGALGLFAVLYLDSYR
jgi:hypothetical protein